MNAIIKMLLYLGMVIALVAIAYANADQRVDVRYFPGRSLSDVPVFLVILGSVFIGVAIAGALAVVEHFRHGRRERELHRRIDALEAAAGAGRDAAFGGAITDAEAAAPPAVPE